MVRRRAELQPEFAETPVTAANPENRGQVKGFHLCGRPRSSLRSRLDEGWDNRYNSVFDCAESAAQGRVSRVVFHAGARSAARVAFRQESQEPMTPSLSEVMSTAQLAEWVHDARERTFELVADLSDEQLMGPQFDIVNPLLWELGHLAWFQSRWVLRHACGQQPVRADEDQLYDSIAIVHDRRWDLPLPTRSETLDYGRQVRDRVLYRIAQGELGEDLIYHIVYTTLHEDMHAEAFTYTRQTLGYPAPCLSIGGERKAGVDGSGPLQGDAEIAGRRFILGSRPEESFVFDNEKWAHPVEVEPFAMARAAVTQAEFAAFVEDGGYGRRQWWSEEGWCWRQSAGAEHPLYWQRQSGGGWLRRHFDRWVGLEPHLPAIHVNWYEAQAYCRWARRRLPSEAEWEMAAASAPDGRGCSQRKRLFPWGDEAPAAGRANLDWQAMGCVDVGALPAGDSGFGCRQMIGNLWEWTSSTFLPYPGFEPDPYKEYSEPWFKTRKVMRGGCWATRSRLIRSNYRNFQTPDRRDVWVGFRTCAA